MDKIITLLLFISIFNISTINAEVENKLLSSIKSNLEILQFVSSNSNDKFELSSVAPRIFVPDEGEKINFSFKNPEFAEVTIRIFDITGSEIKENLDRASEYVMFWDGRDNNNNIVLGGVYIYQVEAAGEIINGTIIVAK